MVKKYPRRYAFDRGQGSRRLGSEVRSAWPSLAPRSIFAPGYLADQTAFLEGNSWLTESRLSHWGGAGAMGSAAVRLAATLPGIGKVVVADRDIDAAKRLSVELAQASAEVEARSIDVTDGRTLRELLDGADVVVNTGSDRSSVSASRILQASDRDRDSLSRHLRRPGSRPSTCWNWTVPRGEPESVR